MKTKTIGLVLVLCAAPLGCTKADSDAVDKTTAETKQTAKAQQAPGAMVSAEAASPQDGPAGAGQISITSKSPEAVALFREGRDLKDNFRAREAREKLNKAIELDPEFALAHAHLAQLSMETADREDHVAKARAAAGNLPKAESLLVEYLSLYAEGKAGKGKDSATKELVKQLVELAPGDWAVQIMAAQNAHGDQDIDGAIKAYERAIALNPKVAQPHNNLAYLYAERGDLKKAMASIDKYAELESGPNPYDSKGEILLMAGKFDDSEAAFQKAADMAPDFVLAFEGVALSRMYRGDVAGGLAALDKAREVATDQEKGKVDYSTVWALVAAGQAKQAYARIDQVQASYKGKDAELAPVASALLRAEVAFELGDVKRAQKEAKKALELGASSKHEMGAAKARWAYVVQLDAALAENNVAAAEKVLATIDAKAVEDEHFTAAVDYAHGAVAAAKGDIAGAKTHFSKLPAKWALELKARKHLANGLAKAGKKDEATKLRAEIASDYRRDFMAVAVQKKIRTDS